MTEEKLKSLEENTNEYALRRDLINKFNKVESNFSVKINPSFGNLVNFSTNQQYAIHKWYYYQEGYSSLLIQRLLKEFKVEAGNRVLDPFCGCGTTLLVASRLGMESVGFEINPFAAFCSLVKTKVYSQNHIENFKNTIRKMKSIDFKSTITSPQLSMIDRLFDKDILEKLLMYKEYILKINDEIVKNLLFFGWLSILEEVSNYRKGGNGLKKKRQFNKKSVKYVLFTKYKTMLDDLINNTNLSNFLEQENQLYVEPKVFNETALNLRKYLNEASIEAAIFSPPYANCFDYCEVYKIELWMGDFVHSYAHLKELRSKALRSHVSVKWLNGELEKEASEPLKSIADFLSNKELWSKDIPYMLQGYFQDMENILKSMYDVLVEKGYCAIVVGNPAYGNITIPSDILLADIARKTGFKCNEIRIARKNETSSQQQKKLGIFDKYLRESIIILKK